MRQVVVYRDRGGVVLLLLSTEQSEHANPRNGCALHINMRRHHQHFDFFKRGLQTSFNLLLKDVRPARPYGRGCTWVSDLPRSIFYLPACVCVLQLSEASEQPVTCPLVLL